MDYAFLVLYHFFFLFVRVDLRVEIHHGGIVEGIAPGLGCIECGYWNDVSVFSMQSFDLRDWLEEQANLLLGYLG